MKTEFEIWRDELAGKRPGFVERSGWWLVAVGAVMVAVAIRFL